MKHTIAAITIAAFGATSAHALDDYTSGGVDIVVETYDNINTAGGVKFSVEGARNNIEGGVSLTRTDQLIEGQKVNLGDGRTYEYDAFIDHHESQIYGGFQYDIGDGNTAIVGGVQAGTRVANFTERTTMTDVDRYTLCQSRTYFAYRETICADIEETRIDSNSESNQVNADVYANTYIGVEHRIDNTRVRGEINSNGGYRFTGEIVSNGGIGGRATYESEEVFGEDRSRITFGLTVKF